MIYSDNSNHNGLYDIVCAKLKKGCHLDENNYMPASHIRTCLDSVGGQKDNSHTTIDYINIDHSTSYDDYLDKVCNAAKSGTFFDRPRTQLQNRLRARDIYDATSTE